MDYETILKNDLYAAMRANDTLRKRVIRLLMSSIELAEVAKGSKLSDSEFIALVQKEIKTKNDTIVDAEKANRPEMVKEQLEEIKVLEGYKPKQLSEAELVQMAEEVIRETGATSPKDMGKVLKVLIPKLAGRATNQDASRVVKDCLTNRS
jgi:uncharacterized protein YqeY